jgi:pyrimidine operon attenuation protein/uracil phosphoribosyltransferase
MNSVETKSAILDRDAVKRKIRRIALEVAEQNAGEEEVVLAGIVGHGEVVAKVIAAELQKLVELKVTLVTIQLDKKNPLHVTVEPSIELLDKVIIIVDDVVNTGKILFYALKPFMQAYPKKLQTLVLVERSHKLFPIQSDYAGLTIATTLQEHIAVEVEGEEISGAWLY